MINKRRIALFTTVCMMLLSAIPRVSSAATAKKADTAYISSTSSTTNTVAPPSISARNAAVISRDTGRVLYEKNAYSRVPMASTTKIMTAIIISETCDLDDVIRVSRRAAAVTGSTMHLAEGEEITVRSLLYGLMLCSGNDAAVALAEHAGGSVEGFAEMMNEKAVDLGALDTHFTSPHGLDDDEHYTTAFDLAVIACRYLQDPMLSEICNTKQISLEGHYLRNTNPLLGVDSHVSGIKTGYTGNAGHCLVIAARNESVNFVIVLLNCASSPQRRVDAQLLTRYAVESYAYYDILPRGHIVADIHVSKGDPAYTRAVLDYACGAVLTKEEYAMLTERYEITETYKAPLAAGYVVGDYELMLGDEVICRIPLVTMTVVNKESFLSCILKVVTSFAYALDV